MNTTQRNGIMQRWTIIQHELMPELRNEVGALTPKLVKLVHTLEWVRIEEFVSSSWGNCTLNDNQLRHWGLFKNARLFSTTCVLRIPHF